MFGEINGSILYEKPCFQLHNYLLYKIANKIDNLIAKVISHLRLHIK